MHTIPRVDGGEELLVHGVAAHGAVLAALRHPQQLGAEAGELAAAADGEVGGDHVEAGGHAVREAVLALRAPQLRLRHGVRAERARRRLGRLLALPITLLWPLPGLRSEQLQDALIRIITRHC